MYTFTPRIVQQSTPDVAPLQNNCGEPARLSARLNHMMENTALFAAIVDTRTLRHRLHSPEYHRLNRTQYIPSRTWGQLSAWQRHLVRAYATARAMTKGCLVSRTAARIHGMWVISLSEEIQEVTTPSRRGPAKHLVEPDVCYRTSALTDAEVTTAYGIRLSTPIRTAIDIARYHGFQEGLIAMDWLLSIAHVNRRDILLAIERMGRVRNCGVARDAARAAAYNADSPMESLARAEFLLRGVTGWQFQAPVQRYRVDFLFDDSVILELDGDIKHASDPRRSLLQERKRERELTNQGYTVLRYGFTDVLHRMDEILARIELERARAKAR